MNDSENLDFGNKEWTTFVKIDLGGRISTPLEYRM